VKAIARVAKRCVVGAACAALLTVAYGRDAARFAVPLAVANLGAASPPEPRLQIAAGEVAPPASQTGGFDGTRAFDYTAKLVSFGPRPPATDAIHRTQNYLRTQLKSFGCAVDEDDFHSQTPIGSVEMKNIIAKIPGEGPGIILLLTHYDTVRIDNFVGADDGGSSTGLMLEMARLFCAGKKQPSSVWIAFLDGEEALVKWSDTDSVYGSRELAARMAVAGDLKRVRAVILADMIGQKDLQIPRESQSTKWLTDLVWNTAARLGYRDVFISKEAAIDDDHGPFLARNVPAVDIIEYEGYVNLGYWHTPKDTLDKISPKSIAIAGHVILESVAALQQKLR
jgi:glutaminyl-peptide cyclotransferase